MSDSKPSGVRVKPLVWSKTDSHITSGSYMAIYRTKCLRYSEDGWELRFRSYSADYKLGSVLSEDDVYSIATSHHEARILAAIEPAHPDLTKAAVAAALEEAAQTVDTLGDSAVTEALSARLCCDGHMCGCQGADVGAYILHHIRALITAPQRDALQAVIDAAKAEARAEDAVKIDELVGVLTRTKQSLGFCAAEFMSLGGLSSEDEELIDQRLNEANAALAQIGAKP